jgi:hypothetical protein
MRNACKIVVGKPEGEGPVLRSKHRLEDDIKINQRNRLKWFELY